jgi:hypothetical protein
MLMSLFVEMTLDAYNTSGGVRQVNSVMILVIVGLQWISDTSTEIILSSTHRIIPSSSLGGPELDEILENLKKSIQIDKRQTNSFLRKHISASDPRVSSAVVGYVGAIIIVAILTVIIILDLPFLMLVVTRTTHNYIVVTRTTHNYSVVTVYKGHLYITNHCL